MTGTASQRVVLAAGEPLVADLGAVLTSGPSGVVWGLQSPQLNVNLVSLNAGDEIADHVNDEVDVVVAVSGGVGQVVVDGEVTPIAADTLALIPRGSTRSIKAETALLYYSIHVRREGPSIGSRGAAEDA